MNGRLQTAGRGALPVGPLGEAGAARLTRLTETWRERVAEVAAQLRGRGFTGRVGLILGSGLGGVADALDSARSIGYGEIAGFPATTVAAHQGRLVAGSMAGVPVIVMQGRSHAYEGLPMTDALLPVAVLACLGIEVGLVTNAAGGLNRFFAPGDLMVIRDHVDLHLCDPLRGLLSDGPGSTCGIGRERCRPDPIYDEALSRSLVEVGATCGVPLREGVYASVWGPNYETRAEIGFLRRIGCDAGGMSTAPEAVLLSRLGVTVAGLSCITNPSREVGQPELSHDEVIEVGRLARDRLTRLLLALLPRLAAAGGGLRGG